MIPRPRIPTPEEAAAFDITGSDHRDLGGITDIPDPANRSIMLPVSHRKVKYQKFICPVITVKTCQLLHITVAKEISLSESCHCFFRLKIQTGNH